jgi:hypothetical protein
VAPAAQTDPSIILGFKPGQPQSPLSILEQAVRIKQMQQQIQAQADAQAYQTPPQATPPPGQPTQAVATPAEQEAFAMKLSRAKARYPDWDAVLQQAGSLPVSSMCTLLIRTSDYGPEVMYWLATHPDEARRISAETTQSPSDSPRTVIRLNARALEEIERIEGLVK